MGWLLVRWSGFNYVQTVCFFLSCLVVMAFILNAAVGLLLHFFTNMFTVTAILGSAAAVWANFKKIEAVVNTVHGEISHAGIIMDHLKTSLTRRILELSHAEKKSERKSLAASATNSKIPEATNFADFDESGDGMIQREELEAKFGKITDKEWRK